MARHWGVWWVSGVASGVFENLKANATRYFCQSRYFCWSQMNGCNCHDRSLGQCSRTGPSASNHKVQYRVALCKCTKKNNRINVIHNDCSVCACLRMCMRMRVRTCVWVCTLICVHTPIDSFIRGNAPVSTDAAHVDDVNERRFRQSPETQAIVDMKYM